MFCAMPFQLLARKSLKAPTENNPSTIIHLMRKRDRMAIFFGILVQLFQVDKCLVRTTVNDDSSAQTILVVHRYIFTKL
jgi:hypothetical protein